MITITTDNLVITLKTWKEILEKNGVSWHVAETLKGLVSVACMRKEHSTP